MKKRILSLLLAAVMIFSLMPVTAIPAAAVTGTLLTTGGTLSNGSYYLNSDVH